MKTFSVFFLMVFQATSFAQGFLPSSFSVKINQVITKITTGREKVTKAILDYKYPGRLKFVNENNSVFISNLERSWYYSPPFIKGEEGTVKIDSSDSLKIVKLFDTLKGGLKTNPKYEVTKVKEGVYRLVFKNSSVKELNIASAVLEVSEEKMQEVLGNSRVNKMPIHKKKSNGNKKNESFSLKDIQNILITYRDKKEVRLVFKDFQEDVNFSADHFVFQVPKGTKTIQ